MEKQKPTWLKTKPGEIENLILKFAKEMPPEKIGLFLRDNYGIPTTKIFNKKISSILKEHKVDFDPQFNLKKKSEKLKVHITKNKTDKCARRALSINRAKIKKSKNHTER